MGKLLRAYLRLLAVLTALSCLGLLFLRTELGAGTPWATAPGWQREIAFWNLSMYIVIVRTLRRGDAAAARLLVTALVVLNFLVGANHFAAVMQGSGALLNTIAGAINIGSGTFGLVALWRERIADTAAKHNTPLPA
jgi:KinB signaling pathway activation protein